MLAKCLLLLTFVGTVYCGVVEPSPPPGCEVDGEIYPIGDDIPSSNPCRIGCFCGDNGRPVCAIVDCFFVSKIQCGGFDPLTDPSQCCPFCPKCEINGTKYEPGDSLPLGDPCSQECECDSAGRILCRPILVGCVPPPRCPLGTKLETLTPAGECCAQHKCVNITCELEGVTYDFGDDIPSEDPCVTCGCGALGPFCSSVGCGLILCPPNHALVEEDVPGQCCPNRTCVPVTCEVDGVTYKGGEPIPDDDPCVSCRCAGTSGNSTRGEPVCIAALCLVSCGGLPSTRLEGECCPVCPPCDYNGTTYESGERIILGDPCTERCECNDDNRISCGPIATECPSIACPNGTKAVFINIPGECCPEVDCVNITCEQNGATYRPGEDIPQADPCTKCQCGSNGEPICLSIDCFFPNCPPGTKRVINRAPGVCCPNVSCVNVTTCEVDEIIYNVGDKIPHEDPCVNCHCRESGPVCGSVGCGLIQCPLNYALVEEDVPGECCPNRTCVPVTCEVDGVTYKGGERIPDDDPCKSCHCSESGPVCGSVGCPPIRCPSNHALVEESVPGECCPNRTCVPVTCEVDGVTYKGGEPIPDDDPCKSCLCAGTSRNSTRGERICAITFCLVSCGGLSPIRLEGECCPVCPPCDYNGTTYGSGDRIILGDPCNEHCVCNDDNRISCERRTIACPLIACPFGTKAVFTNIPGECCPEVDCVNITCEQDGVTYRPGEDIPQEDPCIDCQCGSNGELLCLAVTCYAPNCPPGTERVIMRAPGVCCPNVSCVNVTTCEVNNITYNIGDKIPHEDPCVTCHCSESGPRCGSVGCSLLQCPPFTELAQTPIPGECCPKQECVPKCPPPCTRKLCKSNQKLLCSIPEGGSCLSSACNVTSCKACYYSEGAPRSLPGGCERYTCATKRNNITKLQKCMLKFGKCIRTRDKRLYGQPASRVVRPRNFKCYAFPCEP